MSNLRKYMYRKIVWFSGLIFLHAVALAQDDAVFVNVVQARLTELAPIMWVPGTVISDNNALMSFEVSGRLIELKRIGSTVAKGQIIACIDDERLRLKHDELAAVTATAQHQFTYLKVERERQAQLFSRHLVAKSAIDKINTEYDIAASDLDEARARLAQVRRELTLTVLRAPFDGVITQKLAQIGEYITEQTPVTRLVQTSELEVKAQVPLKIQSFIGEHSRFSVVSHSGERKQVPLKTLVPVANNRSHQMELRLDLHALSWPVGLDVDVAVPINHKKQALVVPRDALVIRREGISVFRVLADNTAEKLSVDIGVSGESVIEVIGGVNPGDRIVIRGAERLRAGQPVKIKNNNDSLATR